MKQRKWLDHFKTGAIFLLASLICMNGNAQKRALNGGNNDAVRQAPRTPSFNNQNADRQPRAFHREPIRSIPRQEAQTSTNNNHGFNSNSQSNNTPSPRVIPSKPLAHQQPKQQQDLHPSTNSNPDPEVHNTQSNYNPPPRTIPVKPAGAGQPSTKNHHFSATPPNQPAQVIAQQNNINSRPNNSIGNNERRNHVYNAYNPGWRYSDLPRRNSRWQYVPSGYRTIYYGGYNYRYCNGVFYRPYYNDFLAVAPPFGIYIDILPFGYRQIFVRNRPYYYYYGSYYDYRDSHYFVVSPPVGAVVESLPEGYEKIVIDGETYYEADGAQYKPVLQENGEIWYEVIKSN